MKSLAVSLSDIAAMGAIPRSALLALNLPRADELGYTPLPKDFFVGADASSGFNWRQYYSRPLSITVVVNGIVPKGEAVLRSSAKVGDLIYVTGTLGDAGLALNLLEKNDSSLDPFLYQRFYRPTPRVLAGTALRRICSRDD